MLVTAVTLQSPPQPVLSKVQPHSLWPTSLALDNLLGLDEFPLPRPWEGKYSQPTLPCSDNTVITCGPDLRGFCSPTLKLFLL